MQVAQTPLSLEAGLSPGARSDRHGCACSCLEDRQGDAPTSGHLFHHWIESSWWKRSLPWACCPGDLCL